MSHCENHSCADHSGLAISRRLDSNKAVTSSANPRPQTEIERREERYRLLVRSSSTLVWTVGRHGFDEEGCQEWLRYTGESFSDLKTRGWLHTIHPDDRTRTKETWIRAARECIAVQLKHRVRRKDGLYRFMYARVVPILDEAGQVREWVGAHTDRTEEEALEAQVRHAHDRFVLATRATTDGIWEVDVQSGEAYYSARWRSILGLPDEEAWGTVEDWLTRVHPYDEGRCRGIWNDIRQRPVPFLEFEFRGRHEDGSWRWILVRAICQTDQAQSLLRVTGAISDITTRKVKDPLTGLHNRTSLLEQLQWRIDRAEEYPRGYCLLFLDLDSFKRINDSLGHGKGDIVLTEVARRLEETVRAAPGSLAARLGGDEFVVLVADVASSDDALTYVQALEYSLARPVDCVEQKIFVSASIGIAHGVAGTYRQASQVLEDADLAMYYAKLNGKAAHAIFQNEMRQKAVERLQLENDLRTAIEEHQFELYYQPKVNLLTRDIKGFEALIRWRSPERGMVLPGDFIAVAEETGLITKIGRWTLTTAIRQMGLWHKSGMVPANATVSVNLSTKQLVEADLVQFLQGELIAAGLNPNCLTIEITESMLVEDSPAAVALLESIAAAGIRLELDDFGTGYSSLSYLHRFPFSCVKIDKSFVQRMEGSSDSVTVVSSIVTLAESLGMSVVAEGVETEEQAAHLVRMGCKLAQGYLYARPMTVYDVEHSAGSSGTPLRRWNDGRHDELR